jgi:phosphoserine phosphatase
LAHGPLENIGLLGFTVGLFIFSSMVYMPYVTTLIAPQQAPFFEEAPLKALEIKILDSKTIESGRAVDVFSDKPVPKSNLDSIRETFKIDILCQDASTRAKRLFMADMDATMVEEETLDELAAHVGLKDKIAAITVRAMNGELDFRAALNERVGLLKGLPVSALADTASKMTFTSGGQTLLKTLKAHDIHCVLVSGGFTYFTSHVANALGFDENYGNTLDISDKKLLGTVAEPILDKNFKRICLENTAQCLGITLAETVAIGDGANDLPMLETASLGVGFRSKKLLRDTLPNHIIYGGLDTLIYGLGLSRAA